MPSVHLLETLPTYYVYALFCQDGDAGYIKFGYTGNPDNRLRALRQSALIPVRMAATVNTGRQKANALAIEHAFHHTFRDRQSMGEWFKFSFSEQLDKDAFNKASRDIFDLFLGKGHWWTTINMVVANEAAAKKRQFLTQTPLGRKILKRIVRDAKKEMGRRRARKELNSYGVKS